MSSPGSPYAIFDHMLEGCQVIDRSFSYLYVNAAAARHGRTTPEQLIGRRMKQVYADIDRTPMYEALRVCMLDRLPQQMDNEFTFADGSSGWFELRMQPVPEGVLVLSVDITEREGAAARVRHLNGLLRGIRNVNQLITRERDPQALIEQACAMLVEARGFSACCIVVVGGGMIQHHAEAGETAKVDALRALLERGQLPQCLERALTQAAPVLLTDPAAGCVECAVATADPSTRDACAARIAHEDEVHGALLVTGPRHMCSDPEELGLIQEVVGDLGFALSNLARERERELVARFLVLANACTGTRELVARAVRFFRGELDIEAVGIRLREGEDFPYYEASGFDPEFVRLERTLCQRDAQGELRRGVDGRPALECMCGIVLRGRGDSSKPFFSAAGNFASCDTTRLLAGTTTEERGTTTRNRCNGWGYESVGLFALRAGGATLGLLQLNDHRRGRLTPTVVALVERLAEQIALALAKTLADDALAASEQRFRELVTNMEDVVFSTDEQGLLTYASPSVQRLYGYTPDEVLGRPFGDFLHRDDLGLASAHFAEVLSGGAAPIELRAVDRQGLLHQVRVTARPRLAQGRASGIDGMVVDVSELRRAERVVRQSEQSYRSLFENTSVGIAHCEMVYDGGRPVDFVYLDVNPAFESLTGLRNVTGKKVSEVIPGIGESDRRLIEIYGRVARNGLPERFEFYVEALKDWYDLSVYCPRPDHFVAVFDVVTRRKQTEEQLRQALKMEAVGQLAGGVAHDFNNLLSVILNAADFAKGALHAADPVQKDLEDIVRAGERAAALTRQLLAFSRRQVLQPEVLDLSALVDDLAKLLRRLLGEHIAVELRLAQGLSPIRADRGQIEQVVMNLAVNARDAMVDGGTLTLETLEEAMAADHSAAGGAAATPRRVLLRVRDTGTGMSAEVMAHLFEPFFTTKPRHKGTGLGLSTVYGIVKQSGGDLRVDSAPGRGTSVEILLPAVAAEVVVTAPRAAPQRTGGNEVVLLVEDDAPLRRMTQRILATAGYSVLAAADGSEALLLCEQRQGPIDLVLSDVVMPMMSGKQLSDRLAQLRPGLQVLFMSGFTDDAIVHQGVLDPGTRFLAKPFTAPQLLSAVRAALDAVDRPADREPGT